MLETAIRCGLVFCMLVTILCASSPTEARRWRYYHQDYRYSDQPVANDRTQDSRSNALGARGTGFGPTMDQLIRGCSQEAAELKNWPFDFLTQIIGADESQRNALQQMQSSVADASDTLASRCPKEIPAALTAKFDALKQALQSFIAALDAVRPAVQKFYAALNDEQKARLVAIYISNNSVKLNSDQFRRASRNTFREALNMNMRQGTICQKWASALRDWPTRQIESTVTLSDVQRAALYDLTGSIYRAAGGLVASCPAETSYTPVGQIEAKRNRVDALAQAINTIRPMLDQFVNTLSDEQKIRLAKVMSATQTTAPRRRGDDDD